MMKVLMTVTELDVVNGISSMVMNYYRNVDKRLVEIDVAAGPPADNQYQYYEEIHHSGGGLHVLPDRRNEPLNYYTELFKLLKKNHYDVIHAHGNSATIGMDMLIGWLCGVKVRIAHSHNSTCTHLRIHKLLLPLLRLFCTHGFACSTLAGNWLFGEKRFYVIQNGIDVDKYRFSLQKQQAVRKKLDLQDHFIVGHVGRFNEQKNHRFLLSVFQEIAKNNDHARLLLVGTGELFSEIREEVQDSELAEKVIFFGESHQIADLMSGMDVFVLPSRHEGLGIVLLEAQISGLPCVASSVVPEEVVLGSNLKFMDLEKHQKDWAEMIENSKTTNENRKNYIYDNLETIRKFDIKENAQDLINLYHKFYYEKRKLNESIDHLTL